MDELFKLIVRVNFVSVPVTVKDHDGHLVAGLLQKDFSIFEDGIPQKVTFFTSDPFPLSTALVIDVGLPETTLKKVSQTYSALTGAFGPFDNTAVFTYGNSVTKQSDFGNAQRLEYRAEPDSRHHRRDARAGSNWWPVWLWADQQWQAGGSGTAAGQYAFPPIRGIERCHPDGGAGSLAPVA